MGNFAMTAATAGCRAPYISRVLLAGAASLLLAGCISIGGKAPDRMLSLTPESVPQLGQTVSGQRADAILVHDPETESDLEFLRVPVRVSASEVAYIKDIAWVERPSRQFQHLVAEILRARSNRLVIEADAAETTGRTDLGGRLIAMGYDEATRAIVVRFEAQLSERGGPVLRRRFESSVPIVEGSAEYVSPAMNQAANDVARQVADWVASGGK